jgi:anti-sigma regulatory factor (Ser/Thr protein kinase)
MEGESVDGTPLGGTLNYGMTHDNFRHEALLYAGDDDFLERTVPFLKDGMEAGEPALVVLNAAKLSALRSELNGHADGVHFADIAGIGSNPACIIPAWREFVDEHAAAGRALRGISEPIWPDRTSAELVECQRHESLLNLAFAGTRSFHLLCPYDTEALDTAVIEEAMRSHPTVVNGHGAEESDLFRDLDEMAAPFAEPLPLPQVEPRAVVFQATTLAALRAFVAERALDAGLATRRCEALVIAANEVATNSVRHAGGGGILRLWHDDEAVLCEIHDTGHIEDPLVGRVRPGVGQAGGHGLWMANQLCDLVQVRTFAGGNLVRLHMRRS